MGGGSGGARPADGAVREGGGSTGAVPTSLRIPQPRRGCRRPPGPESRDAGGRRPRSATTRPRRSRRRDHGVSTGTVPGPLDRAAASPRAPPAETAVLGRGERGAGAGVWDPRPGAAGSSLRRITELLPGDRARPRGRGWGIGTWGLMSPCSWALSTPKAEARIPRFWGFRSSILEVCIPPYAGAWDPKTGGGARISPFPGLVTPKTGGSHPVRYRSSGPQYRGAPIPSVLGLGTPIPGPPSPGAAQQVRPLPGPCPAVGSWKGSGGSRKGPGVGAEGAEGAGGAGAGSGAGSGGGGEGVYFCVLNLLLLLRVVG